eukprot:gb/GECG01015454.1/.p1 GENE.gb/GECG01015454.1/~~gb/GECG01015454.1/.p1  ORF type:complete len:115 (+),score=18.26 gb/GECG01015454.1/:1-345(+)
MESGYCQLEDKLEEDELWTLAAAAAAAALALTSCMLLEVSFCDCSVVDVVTEASAPCSSCCCGVDAAEGPLVGGTTCVELNLDFRGFLRAGPSPSDDIFVDTTHFLNYGYKSTI